MKRLACRYAILRFVPYPETGEFANVGIVVVEPGKNKLTFKLEQKKTQRLTHFFHHLDKSIYRDSITAYHNELQYLQKKVDEGSLKAAHAFDLLVQPREAILSFAEARGILFEGDLNQALSSLYADYVCHDFAKKTDYEAQLKSKVKNLVKDLNLQNPFVPCFTEKMGFKVNFELAQVSDNQVNRVIKPLSFAEKDAAKIFEHAHLWLGKFDRLKTFDLLPKDIIFPFEMGAANEESMEAFEIIKSDFGSFGDVTNSDNKEAITNFAQG
jgi:hypothetical protein